MIWLNSQSIRDQMNRHSRVTLQDLMELVERSRYVIDDDNRDTHVFRKMIDYLLVGIEASSRTAHANDTKAACQR